ncbi:MAG: small basic protein [Planctomycetes bacterium]|nr:small basic protein [Planctomycetota bacterium]
MSIDKSLTVRGRLGRTRSVFSRAERVKMLEGEGRWSREESVFGLPKVKSVRLKKKPKAEKAPPKEGEAATPGAEVADKGEKA